MKNCDFQYLGSDGDEKSHDLTGSQSEQADFWASSQTSNGGTMRCRDCQDVKIDSCSTSYCLRGFRIQTCSSGFITNCRAYRLLESAFYLASGTYDGTEGCTNFVISGCEARSIFHSGFLVIGGHSNTITGCCTIDCVSSPFNGWHTQDLRIIGCIADNCNTKDFIGIGVLGDSYGQVYMAGKQNITTTGGYLVQALNNSFTRCGSGRAALPTLFYFRDNAGVSSSRFIVDGNHSDADTLLHNPDGITSVKGQYPARFSGTADRALLTSGAGAVAVSAVTSTELGYLSGVSSALQTQIDESGFSGTADRALLTSGAGAVAVSSVTSTELGYLSGVSSAIQTQIDSASGFSGTADRALQTSGAGAVAVSAVTSTELGYLSGASSSLQDQLATKLGMSNNSVTITQGSGADTSIYLKRGGDAKQFSITRKSTYTKWKTIGGGSEHFITFDDGRFDFKTGITRLAPISSLPSENAGNAKGGFWFDSSSSPGVLKWHDGVAWKTVTLS